MKRLTILGSTGSIGCSTLEVLRLHRDDFDVFALGARASDSRLLEQCLEFSPEFAVLEDAQAAARLERSLRGHGCRTEVLAGAQALVQVAAAPQTDMVMAAIVGAAGLDSALAAARAGKRVLLANKESLVVAGDLFMQAMRDGGGELLPIDSEHSAILQSLPEQRECWPRDVREITLTASGGPFRRTDPAQLAAIVGAAGLDSALAAARAGKRVLLANKESLVVAGDLFMQAMRDGGGELLPIDSEHSAILQSLPEQRECWARDVREITLTASGGPFRRTDPAQLATITPEQACAHPNWSMGRKISVDSATMMNKALEVIEAHHLFAMPADRIRVLIHPQSIVHSMVTYHDGSVVAQLGAPDMRTPIAYGLSWPRRMASGSSWLDLAQVGRLEFERPDAARFPGLGLAYAALRMPSGACAVLNAANEVAVQAFLDGALGFTDIHRVNASTLERLGDSHAQELGALLELDASARREASTQVRAVAR